MNQDIAFDRTALEAIFELPNNDGIISAHLQAYFQSLGAKKPTVVLAFPPKAAGTFLRTAATTAIGGDLVRIVYAQGSRDAQLYVPTLIGYYLGGFSKGPMVSHIHMQAFPANTSVLEAFDIRPTIMVRSIPDMLASYWDMLERSTAAHQGINCTIPVDFREIAADRKADFLTDVIGPWYVGYYATWLEYAARHADRVLVLKYGDFVQKPAESLSALLKHAGVLRTLADCQQAIGAVWKDRRSYRFNEGKEGRAYQYFSMRHLERIGRMLSYYSSTAEMRGELIGL